jgi:hypothetical protein
VNDTSQKDILKRLERLEKAVFGARAVKTSADRPPSSREGALPAHISKLKDQGFLKTPRTAVEVKEKLQPTYHCDIDRVAMALLRLHKRKQLRKTTKRVGARKHIAYVW